MAQVKPVTVRLGAQVVITDIRVDPVPGARSANQVVVQQPLLTMQLRAWHDRLRFDGAFDAEGWTMPDGVLTLGAWGEGFLDRRHPHTYAHELILSLRGRLTRGRLPVTASMSVGKGFVPFGSDDPMNRPAIAFPINHHWSQILERAVAMVGITVGPVTLETARFNGDEPEYPGQWPRISGRFGDSWSHRATVAIGPELTVTGSVASVKSPEHRPGAGTDQRKAHVAARFERARGQNRWYGLTEWARTSEAGGFFVFHSVLGETEWASGRHRLYYRFERTDRPEEERTVDPFRSLRPHLENSILGVTRWTVHTAGYGFRLGTLARRVGVEPIAELAAARVADHSGTLFRAVDLYGRTSLWSASIAIRLSAGMHHAMGRYGTPSEAHSPNHPTATP